MSFGMAEIDWCIAHEDETEWKASDTFGRDDLLVLAKVADQAHSWICTATKADRESAR